MKSVPVITSPTLISGPRMAKQSALQGEILTDFAGLEALSDDWERLRAAGRRPEAFQRFGWSRAAWRALGQGRSLVTVVVRSGDEVVGLLPLSLEGRRLTWLATIQSDYNDLLADASDAGSVLAAAFDALLEPGAPDWRDCILEHVPADGNLPAAAASLPMHLRSRVTSGWLTPCPTLIIGDDREAALQPLIRKSSLKRHTKKLSKLGEVTFRHIEDRDEARSHLPTFFHQHIRRRAMAHDSSQMLLDEQRAFYEALVEELDPATTLRFGVLELDGRPVAYHFGFQSDRKLIWYKPAFDVDLWDEGPGEVLVRELLLYCLASGVREFDFTIGAVGFKERFANVVRLNETITFHRPPAAALARRPVVVGRDFAVRRPRVRGWFRDGRELAEQVLPERSPQKPERERRVRGDGDLAVRDGSLGDLADLSVFHPEEISADDLHAARKRIKAGDRLLVGTRDGEISHFAWLGQQRDGSPPVVHDRWVSPAHREDDEAMAALLAQAAEARGRPG